MTKFMYDNDSLKEAIETSNPLKRSGNPHDMAGTILYLVSKAGAFTNGTVVVVDGGAHLHDSFLTAKV
jgi:NAD(P)-dependent dehydrogenase (short-subunit alcohol dehydrogenase family)